MKDDYKDTFIYPLRAPTGGATYRILDGDNMYCLMDMGEGEFRWRNVRIAGVDAPEIRSSIRQRPYGTMVKTVLAQWLAYRLEDETLRIRVKSVKWDKYAGRIIGKIYFIRPDGSETPSLNEFLLEKQLVKPYKGSGKEPWTDEELEAIADRCKALLAGDQEELRP